MARKPGALASSVAFSQMEPKLLNIYNRYYKGAEKSFIDLIELTSKIGICRVEAAISELEKLNLKAITTDKIVTICQRVNFPVEDKIIKHDCQIEQASRQILNIYSDILLNRDLTLTGVK